MCIHVIVDVHVLLRVCFASQCIVCTCIGVHVHIYACSCHYFNPYYYTVHATDCSVLSTVFQLALSREQELENKLASMQEVINTSRQLATESMIVRVRIKMDRRILWVEK